MKGVTIVKKTLLLFKRLPVSSVMILLFAAIVSVIICALQASKEEKMRNYEETYKTVPITVTVTDPSETNTDIFLIASWVYDLFAEQEPRKFYDVSAAKDFQEAVDIKCQEPSAEFSLAKYVKDIQVKMQQAIGTVNGQKIRNPLLYGISSISCDKQLLPENGCVITWKEGYDESVFLGDKPVCLIPSGMVEKYDNGSGEVILDFDNKSVGLERIDGKYQMVEKVLRYQSALKIVGTYTAGDELSIYCPVSIVKHVCSELNATPIILQLSATLADNSLLEEFREKASYCFLEPSPNAEETHWGCFVDSVYNELYRFAIHINDENLAEPAAILEESIKFNRTVTIMVVALSIFSGFLVGFLMIRHRKRDIILMRTVGESNAKVYFGFVLEQMICIILGIAIGGAFYRWNPMDKLAIFAIAYFVALSFALVIFMSKKLIKNVKEDE
jgi:hypothetical protein